MSPQKKRKITDRSGDRSKRADEIAAPAPQPMLRQELHEALAEPRPYKRADSHNSIRGQSRDSFPVLTPATPASLATPSVASQEQATDSSRRPSVPSSRKRLVDLLAPRERPAENDASSFNTIVESESDASESITSSPSYRRDLGNSARVSPDVNGGDALEPSNLVSTKLRSPGVTYARQRSFLSQIPVADGVRDEDYLLCSKADRSVGQLPAAAGSGRPFLALEHDNDDDVNGTGPVRSIHELRQAGGNARFVGSVDSIFEEIEDPYSTQSGRCQGFLQLCTRLLDTQFWRGFLESGFDKRLSENFNDQLDVMSASLALCAYALACLCGPLPSSSSVSFWSGLIALTPTLLEKEDDILILSKKQGRGYSKAVCTSVSDVYPSILSALSTEQAPSRLSPRFLALRGLHLAISNVREKDEKSVDNIPLPLLTRLVDLLLSEGQAEVEECALSTEGVQILTLIFPILDAYTLLKGTLTDDDQDAIRPLSRLYNLLTLKKCNDDWSRQLPVLYMRVILNITNISPSLSGDLATPLLVGGLVQTAVFGFREVPNGPSAGENNSLDTAILAIGCLINLTEASEPSRQLFLRSDANSPSSLHALLHFFTSSVGCAQEVGPIPQDQPGLYLTIRCRPIQ